ncbi:MAG: DUF6798 domain-containing protein [Cyanobacteria bacterium J06635_1]
MPLKLSLRSLETYGLALLSALVAYGYSFTRSNTYNQMPSILALMDSTRLSQDFYIQEMTQFTPRFYYYHLMLFGHQLGLSLPVVAFGLFVLAFGSMVLGLWALGRYLGRSEFAGVALAFLALAIEDSTLGKTDIFRIEPIAAIYAMGIAIWGMYFCCRRQWRRGYLMFGLACLLQFLIGLLPAGLWGVPLVIDALRQRQPLKQWVKLLGPMLIFGLFASLVYVPMVLTGNTSSTTLSDAVFIDLYGYIRHPHHIVVSSFPINYWRSFLSLTGAGLICLWLSTTLSTLQKRQVLVVIATAFGLLLVGYVFVEQVPIAFVTKLQFARTTPFALMMALAAIAVVASEYHRRGNYPVSLLLIGLPLVDRVGPILLLILTGLLWLARTFESKSLKPFLKPLLNPLIRLERLTLTARRDIAISYALFLIVLLACWAYLPIFFASLAYPLGRRTFPNFFERAKRLFQAGLAGLVLYLGLNLSGVITQARLTPLHRKLKLYTQQDDPLKQVAAQFGQVSPIDALVLVPPSDVVFRYYAERSVVVTFKSFPFTDQGILTWQARLERILGPLSDEMIIPAYADALYSQRSSQELAAIAQEYQAGYILTRRSWHPDMEGKVVAETEDWIVWQLPEF